MTTFELFAISRDDAVLDILGKRFWNTELKKIVEFGCAKMRLFRKLRQLDFIEHIMNVDIDKTMLLKYSTRVQPLLTDNLKERERPLFVEVFEGNMLHSVKELQNVDVVIALDVIQDLEPMDLQKATENIFGFIQPKLVILSTPNSNFFSSEVSHTRELDLWSKKICGEFPNYSFTVLKIGFVSQITVFARNDIVQRPLAKPINTNLKPIENSGMQYKLIYAVDYPFIMDKRTQTEKVQHKINDLLQNIFQTQRFYDDVQCVYRIPISFLVEYGNTIGLDKDEILFQLEAQKFTLHNEFFIVTETFMANKYGREYDVDYLDFTPYHGCYMPDDEINVAYVCQDDEEENWD